MAPEDETITVELTVEQATAIDTGLMLATTVARRSGEMDLHSRILSAKRAVNDALVEEARR